MGFQEEIKKIRQKDFLTQQDFSKEIQVALRIMWTMQLLKKYGLILKWRRKQND